MSLALGERRVTTLRPRRDSPVVASRTTLRFRSISVKRYLNSSRISVANMLASTSAFATVTWPDQFLLCASCSASSRGFPDVAAQAQRFAIAFDGKLWTTAGTSCTAPVRLSLLPLYVVHSREPG